MIVTNKTSIELYINGNTLKPGEFMETYEGVFNSVSVHSDIGSCVIITEYGERRFRNFGKIIAKEGRKKDKYNLKNIIIKSIE